MTVIYNAIKVFLRYTLIVLSLLLLVVFALGIYLTVRPRIPPKDAINISFPLRNGPYFVTQNGPDGSGVHKLPVEKYAMDIIKGIPFFRSSIERNLTDFPIYGNPIFSPCFGNVKTLRDGQPDNQPGIMTPDANTIIIGCNGFDVFMTHIKNGSFKVKLGQKVRTGDPIAEVGNSGNSTEPHLHIMIFKEDKDGNKTPYPITFDGKYYLRWDSIPNTP